MCGQGGMANEGGEGGGGCGALHAGRRDAASFPCCETRLLLLHSLWCTFPCCAHVPCCLHDPLLSLCFRHVPYRTHVPLLHAHEPAGRT